jgi:hypothetical protein
MGLFSSWNRDNDFDLTAEDLATCEGYVTVEAFRKLQAAKASARSDAGGSLYALARFVATRVRDVVAVAMDAAPASIGTPGVPPASTAPTAPSQTPAVDRIDKAA